MNDQKNIIVSIQQLKKDLFPLFEGYPAIRSAYLFGSAATGHAGPDSDIDIAIRCAPEISPESGFNLRLELMDKLENVFKRPTDVVLLNFASLVMIRQVLIHGVLVYAKNPEKEHAWAIQKRKEYFDFKYYIDRNRNDLKSYFGVV
jgi:predicted nucleotidyltransferase